MALEYSIFLGKDASLEDLTLILNQSFGEQVKFQLSLEEVWHTVIGELSLRVTMTRNDRRQFFIDKYDVDPVLCLNVSETGDCIYEDFMQAVVHVMRGIISLSEWDLLLLSSMDVILMRKKGVIAVHDDIEYIPLLINDYIDTLTVTHKDLHL